MQHNIGTSTKTWIHSSRCRIWKFEKNLIIWCHIKAKPESCCESRFWNTPRLKCAASCVHRNTSIFKCWLKHKYCCWLDVWSCLWFTSTVDGKGKRFHWIFCGCGWEHWHYWHNTAGHLHLWGCSLCVIEERLGFKSLHTTTRAKGIFNEVSKCVIDMKLLGTNLCDWKTDGVAAKKVD